MSFRKRWRPEGPSGTLSLALVPNALNCVRLGVGDGPAAEWWIYPQVGFGLLPPGFQFLMLLGVTDAELDVYLAKLIAEASKVSKELAEFLKDNVKYTGEAKNHTTLINPTGGKTKVNTHILISKDAIKAALEAINAETDADDKAKMQEDLFRLLLEVLLHEAGHRMAIVNSTEAAGAAEEDRNTTALIKRLMDLLKALKTNVPGAPPAGKLVLGDGDGLKDEKLAKWMERLKAVIKGEKVYRFQWLTSVPPWKAKYDHIKRAWKDFKDKLDRIRADNSKTPQQKQQAAQAALDAANADMDADRTALQNEFDVTIDFGFDANTLQPTQNNTGSDSYKGQAIPVPYFVRPQPGRPGLQRRYCFSNVSIPLLRMASRAFAEARKSMSCLAWSFLFDAATSAAEKTEIYWICCGMVPT